MEPKKPNDPDELGGWRINGRLGEGGFGTVYLAEKGAQKAAIKVIRQEFVEESEAKERLAIEAEVLSKLSDPAIGKILDSNLNDSLPWIATEFVNGPTLEAKVKYEGPLDEIAWFNLAADIFHAIVSANKLGVIHKDIKPSNIILGETGNKLIDFGIAHISGQTRTSAFGEREGSTPFSSPEHFTPKSNPKMDVFSAAATLAFAGKGSSIWKGENDLQLMRSINEDEPNFDRLTEDQQSFLKPLLEKNHSDRSSPVEAYENALKYIEYLLGKGKRPKILKRYKQITKYLFARRFITTSSAIFVIGILTLNIPNFRNLPFGFNSSSAGSSSINHSGSDASEMPNVNPSTGITNSPSTENPNSIKDQVPTDSLTNSKPGNLCDELSTKTKLSDEASLLKACKQDIAAGELNSYYRLGFYYYNINKIDQAVRWWRDGAEAGSAISMYRLASVLQENGEFDQAKNWYSKCVDTALKDKRSDGATLCMNGMGEIFFREKNLTQSRIWYQRSADLGSQEGIYRLALNYSLAEENEKALEYFLKLKTPNLGTKIAIGEAYRKLGNSKLAFKWLLDAGEDGSLDAYLKLGTYSYEDKTYVDAEKYWKIASSKGLAEASHNLGVLFAQLGKSQESEKYYKLGADRGYLNSIVMYAFLLSDRRDYESARTWFQKGVDLGDDTSMLQLGALYRAIFDDSVKSCELWRMAAKLKNQKATENVQKFCQG